jgi:hypothetical protein
MDTIMVGAACTLALAFYVLARPGPKRAGVSLPTFYLAGLALYAIGSFSMFVTGGYTGAHAVTLMSEAALFSGCLGAIVGLLLFEPAYPKDYAENTLAGWTLPRKEQAAIYWGLAISALVCLGFSYEVLRNQAIWGLLSDVFSPSDAKSLLEARKAITNGTEGYFAPGFVKQFRDTLIPILLSAVILIAVRQRLNIRQKVIVLATGLIALVAMLLTGIRSNLFLLFVTLYVAYTVAQGIHGKMSRRKKRRQFIFILIAIGIYGALTVLLGRVDQYESRSALALDVVSNLLDRIVMAAPRENIMSYTLWSNLKPSLGGYWVSDLRGILPGSGDVNLSNLLHQFNGGSIEGNSSIGLPVDVWLNWGWIGLVILPMLYGLFLTYFDCKLTNMRSPVAFGIKVVLALALVKIYSPFGFVLYGGLAAIILYLGLEALRAEGGDISRARAKRIPHAQASG